MKLQVLIVSVLCVGISFVPDAEARRRTSRAVTGCSRIVSVYSGFIYKNSAPIRASSAIHAPIVGFRTEPTLISNGPSLIHGSVPILDSRGGVIGRCPWTSTRDHRGGRYRCGMGTGALRRTALRNTRSPKIYFPIAGKACVEIPDAGRCFGSVKGLCNRTLM